MKAMAKVLGLAVGLAACNQVLGIGDAPRFTFEEPSTGGFGGAGGSGGDGGAPGGEDPRGPCAQPPECSPVDSRCVALTDNANRTTMGWRIMQANVTRPRTFETGAANLESVLLDNAVLPNLPDCRLNHAGFLNIIVEVDIVNGTGRAGVARPVPDPRNGYAFIQDEVLPANSDGSGQLLNINPVNFTGSLEAGILDASSFDSVFLPVFLDQEGANYVMLPLRGVRFFDVNVSDDFNCIGAYDEFNLDPNFNCEARENQRPFIPGGQVQAYILLEEADDYVLEFPGGVDETLCATLARGIGGPFTENNMGTRRCKRDGNGMIELPGDWCAATNGPQTSDCRDAMEFRFSFAASAVEILN
ncbi:MAG: hypothetical protein AAGN82_15955 [Myxococcota bacterium]